jgi:biopolymer transport protein ExbD
MASYSRPALHSPVLKGITPLLDVLFILLFALLALSETKTANPAELLRVQLPQVAPEANQPVVDPQKLVLVLNANSQISIGDVDGVVTTLEEFDAVLASVIGDALPEDIAIEIQGDRMARHGTTVGLLQHLRLRGFQKVMFLVAGGDPASFLEETE